MSTSIIFFETVFAMAIFGLCLQIASASKRFQIARNTQRNVSKLFSTEYKKSYFKSILCLSWELENSYKEDFYNKIKLLLGFSGAYLWFVFEYDFNTNFTQYYLFLLFYIPLLNFAQKPNKNDPYYNALAYKLVTYLRKKKVDEKEAKHLLIDMLIASPYMYQTFDELKNDIEEYKIFRTSMLNRWKDAEQIIQTKRKKDVDEVFLQNRNEAKKMFEKGYKLENSNHGNSLIEYLKPGLLEFRAFPFNTEIRNLIWEAGGWTDIFEILREEYIINNKIELSEEESQHRIDRYLEGLPVKTTKLPRSYRD